MLAVVVVPLAVVMVLLLPALRLTVEGHGMLLDPPQRSSLWRDDRFPDAPINNQDSGLFCGGFNVQYNLNHGRCGICGDAFSDPSPRPNEAGGKYGRGIIARTYSQGDVITVTVRITANHLGYFTFKLCPNDNVKKEVTQECLDKHVLKVFYATPAGEISIGDKYPVGGSLYGDNQIRLKLPGDVTCSQCVLQWTYKAGHNWDCDPDGTCGIGHGKQETFVNCADIAIDATTGPAKNTTTAVTASLKSDVNKMKSTAGQSAATLTDDSATTTEAKKPYTTPSSTSESDFSKTRTTDARDSTASSQTTTATTTTTMTVTRGGVCRSAGAYAGKARVDVWCKVQCAVGYCPSTHCTCN